MAVVAQQTVVRPVLLCMVVAAEVWMALAVEVAPLFGAEQAAQTLPEPHRVVVVAVLLLLTQTVLTVLLVASSSLAGKENKNGIERLRLLQH